MESLIYWRKTMTEEFVTLETAKLLKEKGFKEDVFTFYEVDCVEGDMILLIFGLAKHLDIDLLWHIEQKMRYNELRPMLNGKRY